MTHSGLLAVVQHATRCSMLARALHDRYCDALQQPGSNRRTASTTLMRSLNLSVDFCLVVSNELLPFLSSCHPHDNPSSTAEVEALFSGIQALERLFLELYENVPNRFGAHVPSADVPDLIHTLQYCVNCLCFLLTSNQQVDKLLHDGQYTQRIVDTLTSSQCSLGEIRLALAQLVSDTHIRTQSERSLQEVVAEARGDVSSAAMLPARMNPPAASYVSESMAVAVAEWVAKSGIGVPAALLWCTLNAMSVDGPVDHAWVLNEQFNRHIQHTYGGTLFAQSCLARLQELLCSTTIPVLVTSEEPSSISAVISSVNSASTSTSTAVGTPEQSASVVTSPVSSSESASSEAVVSSSKSASNLSVMTSEKPVSQPTTTANNAIITRDAYEHAMKRTLAASGIASISALVDNQCVVVGMGNVWAEPATTAPVVQSSHRKLALFHTVNHRHISSRAPNISLTDRSSQPPVPAPVDVVSPDDRFVPWVLKPLFGLRVTMVSCGGQHLGALTDTGSVFMWGNGAFGRLGIGALPSSGSAAVVRTPTLVKSLQDEVRVKQITCGFAHTAAVTESGELWTWGAGANGRLGTGSTKNEMQPCFVSRLNQDRVAISSVHAGSVHTCALSDTHTLYTFGKQEYTGHALNSDVLVPTPVLEPFNGTPVVQVSVGPGGYHTIALTSTSQVYTWGHNRVGQLGYPTKDNFPRNKEGAIFVPVPRLVEALNFLGVSKVAAGWGHTAVVTKSGEVWVCGRGLHGQLGVGDPRDLPVNEREHPFLDTFTRVESLVGSHVRDVACGGEHTAVVVDEDQLYTFGYGLHGQLGHGSVASVTAPKRVDVPELKGRKIVQFVCGTNVTMVVVGMYVTVPSLVELCWDVVDAREGWQEKETVQALQTMRIK